VSTTTNNLAWAAAETALARKGRSFFWARRLLGPVPAARATRLYGFCRYLDDLADEATSMEEARVKLGAASREIAAGLSADPMIQDGIDLMHECRISPLIAVELVKGLLSDLDPVRCPDEAALLQYCYRVAGTVGVMMCGVLDVSDRGAFAHAIDLGIAMQLTNICRDIATDAAANRRYLPASLIGDLAPEELIKPLPARRLQLRAVVEDLLNRADRHYTSGEIGISYLPLRARSGILVAGRVYRAIGTRLRAQGSVFWDRRIMVSDGRKAALTAHALISAPCQRFFWRKPSGHDASLHDTLRGLPGIETIHAPR
jgi:phytoene synthase